MISLSSAVAKDVLGELLLVPFYGVCKFELFKSANGVLASGELDLV